MRSHMVMAAAAAIAAAIITGTVSYGADVDDPYLWLEDIHGAKPLAWVNEKNALSLKQLKGDPAYQANYDTLLAILDADDRIPMGALHGDTVFNFWQDQAHVRGIWRRTTVASYESPNPQWETIIDLDRLAADEGKSWVWKKADCSPDLTRCLVALSPGGGGDPLKPGDTIRDTESGLDLEELVSQYVHGKVN